MKIILGVIGATLSAVALAGMVVNWSGRREQITTVTGKPAVRCYYFVNREERALVIVGTTTEPFPPCPSQITVE